MAAVCLREELICIRSQTRTQRGFFLFWIWRIFKVQPPKNESVNKLGAEWNDFTLCLVSLSEVWDSLHQDIQGKTSD